MKDQLQNSIGMEGVTELGKGGTSHLAKLCKTGFIGTAVFFLVRIPWDIFTYLRQETFFQGSQQLCPLHHPARLGQGLRHESRDDDFDLHHGQHREDSRSVRHGA